MKPAASFNRLAEAELRDATTFYESASPGLGMRLIDAVEAAVSDLQDHPLSGPVARGRIRRKIVNGFPYQLLYRFNDAELRILAVMHLRRRPFYWAART